MNTFVKTAWILAAAAAAGTFARGVDGQESPLDATREAVRERMEIERLISKEKLDWAVGRELLQSRIDLTQRQIDSLRENIGEFEQGVVDLGGKLGELGTESRRLQDASGALAERVEEFEARVRALLPRLPDPLLERVRPLSQSLPEEGATDIESSLSQRYMTVVGILTQVNKFNREITVKTERRQMPGGSTANVTTMYIGLGQAYFVTANGAGAGIGRPGAAGTEGWIWTPANEHAEAIAKAIAVYKNEQVAEFIPLPLQVD